MTSERAGTTNGPGEPPQGRGEAGSRPDPPAMRAALADYVTAVHGAYMARAELLAPAEQGRLPLLASGRFAVAVAAARDLHVIATAQSLGPLREPMVEHEGEVGGLAWRLRFYDAVVLPELGLIAQTGEAAQAAVRRALGVATTLYHLIAPPGSDLGGHHATHVGTALAGSDSSVLRDLELLRRHVGRGWLVDELDGALTAGLPHAASLLAREIAPGDARVAALAAADDVDLEALRAALVAAVRGQRHLRAAPR